MYSSYFMEVMPFEVRKAEAIKIMTQNPRVVPVIVEKMRRIPMLAIRVRHVLQRDLPLSHLYESVKSYLKLEPCDNLVLHINGIIPRLEDPIGALHNAYCHDDLFLYISYSNGTIDPVNMRVVDLVPIPRNELKYYSGVVSKRDGDEIIPRKIPKKIKTKRFKFPKNPASPIHNIRSLKLLASAASDRSPTSCRGSTRFTRRKILFSNPKDISPTFPEDSSTAFPKAHSAMLHQDDPVTHPSDHFAPKDKSAPILESSSAFEDTVDLPKDTPTLKAGIITVIKDSPVTTQDTTSTYSKEFNSFSRKVCSATHLGDLCPFSRNNIAVDYMAVFGDILKIAWEDDSKVLSENCCGIKSKDRSECVSGSSYKFLNDSCIKVPVDPPKAYSKSDIEKALDELSDKISSLVVSENHKEVVSDKDPEPEEVVVDQASLNVFANELIPIRNMENASNLGFPMRKNAIRNSGDSNELPINDLKIVADADKDKVPMVVQKFVCKESVIAA